MPSFWTCPNGHAQILGTSVCCSGWTKRARVAQPVPPPTRPSVASLRQVKRPQLPISAVLLLLGAALKLCLIPVVLLHSFLRLPACVGYGWVPYPPPPLAKSSCQKKKKINCQHRAFPDRGEGTAECRSPFPFGDGHRGGRKAPTHSSRTQAFGLRNGIEAARSISYAKKPEMAQIYAPRERFRASNLPLAC